MVARQKIHAGMIHTGREVRAAPGRRTDATAPGYSANPEPSANPTADACYD
jgi:hypothetical protein